MPLGTCASCTRCPRCHEHPLPPDSVPCASLSRIGLCGQRHRPPGDCAARGPKGSSFLFLAFMLGIPLFQKYPFGEAQTMCSNEYPKRKCTAGDLGRFPLLVSCCSSDFLKGGTCPLRPAQRCAAGTRGAGLCAKRGRWQVEAETPAGQVPGGRERTWWTVKRLLSPPCWWCRHLPTLPSCTLKCTHFMVRNLYLNKVDFFLKLGLNTIRKASLPAPCLSFELVFSTEKMTIFGDNISIAITSFSIS